MDRVVCPHCKSRRLVSVKVPKEVVAVLPCPSCNELTVMYRGRAIGLSRRIIEEGNKAERARHLAEVIAEFLEHHDAPFSFDQAAQAFPMPSFGESPDDLAPISDQEFEKFVRIDLKCLDNGAYFKRHFDKKP